MKKLIYLMLTAVLVFTSCSSDEPAFIPSGGEPEVKSQVINLSINGIKEFTETSSNLRSTSLQDAGITDLYYMVYNGNSGEFIKMKRFTDLTALSIRDTLSLGKYEIGIFATTVKDLKKLPYADPLYFASSRIMQLSFFMLDPFYVDYFCNSMDLIVGQTTQEVNMNLERQTAKIEILPTDISSIPDDIDAVVFRITGVDGAELDFMEKKYNKIYPRTYPVPEEYYSIKVTKAELASVNAQNPISFLYLAIGSQTEYPIQAGFIKTGETKATGYVTLKQSYNLERNKVLRLTGRLFTKNVESGDITVDTQWGEVVDFDFD